MEGYGEITYSSGDMHKGLFEKGKKHGLGIQYIKSTNEYIIGEWVKGMLITGKQVKEKPGQGSWIIQNKGKFAYFNSKEELTQICKIEVKNGLAKLAGLDKSAVFKLYDIKNK